MINKIQHFIEENNLCNSGTPILIACSGGVDSMVLIEVLVNLKYKIAVAHCNFNLRGAESDGDAVFVEQYCLNNKIDFYYKKFDTKKYKQEQKISTQMVARNLRYEWFEQIRKENGFHFIATAHHLDDQLETILLNFTKGTGVNGLKGMLPKNNFIIRPMLAVSKQDILQFATEKNIEYRTDSSNDSKDYLRNKIRHDVVPILSEINPSLIQNINSFSNYMIDAQTLIVAQIKAIKKKCWSEKNGTILIHMNYIKEHRAKYTILYYLLKDFGFTQDSLLNILESKHVSTQFYSPTHRLIVDRNKLIVSYIQQEKNEILLFDKIPNQIIFNDIKIQCKIVPIEKLNIKSTNNYAYVDVAKISLPLKIRFLNEGDYFYPFGLGKSKNASKIGKKKVSKYFRDEKLNLLEKENTAIIFSDEKVVWLVGHRIDDRFKITAQTTKVLKLKLIK
jgi:tRNA(Ile)-lysidine synthase